MASTVVVEREQILLDVTPGWRPGWSAESRYSRWIEPHYKEEVEHSVD